MLEVLRLRNLAVVESAELEFGPGLNILSGETGSGKSIIVEAISLLLGARAHADLVRKGTTEASVEGLFDCRELPSIRPILEVMGVGFASESTLLIRRQLIRADAGFRQRTYLNGVLVPLTQIQEIGAHLIDLCSQHEHQALLKNTQQMLWMDRFAQLEPLRIQLDAALQQFRKLQSEILHWDRRETERLQELDFLRFQVSELESANLEAGEEESLQARKRLLQSVESRRSAAQGIQAIFEGDESPGLIAALRKAESLARPLSGVDPELDGLVSRLNQAVVELTDLEREWMRYAGRLEVGEDELQNVLARLSELQQLKRKYGESFDEMALRLETLKARLQTLDSEGGDLEALRASLDAQERALCDVDALLQKKRDLAAREFGKRVTAELHQLDMTSAALQVMAGESQELPQWTSVFGSQQRNWMIQTNAGESVQPLQKIVSGGELSRIMLAIRQVVTGTRSVGVYLFDEIDSGMGGRTAFAVGQKLKRVAQGSQVICITHLPQVGAFADQHFQVEKLESKGRTHTQVRKLSAADRVIELARMLSGRTPSGSSLRNAKELLQQASDASGPADVTERLRKRPGFAAGVSRSPLKSKSIPRDS